ncbi:MAG: hypothetical protein HY815_12335 [Candidatus Riflebacteria bacterium]|nr:hypothetical protein [Candidatus Riflebacteria bacterium]
MAWLLANVIMMQRENPRSREALLNSRNRARSRLRSVTDADRRARIHERTDIRAGELPALLDLLWSGRVASSIRLGERSYVLISVLCTGGSPLMHLESAEPLNPLAWEPDGGTILVAAGVPDTPSIQVWRVAADGSTVKDIPGFRPPPGYDPSTGAAHVYRWRAVPRIDMNPGTGAWCALVLQDFSKVETPGVPLDQLGVTLWGLWRVHPDFPPNYVHNIFCSLIHTIASPLAFSPSGDLAVVAWTASGTTLSLPPDTIGFNLPVIETEPFSAFMGHGLAEETSSALIAPRGTVIGGLSWAKLRSEWIAFALFKPGGKAEVVFQKPVRSGKPPREVVPLPRSPLDLAALDLGSLTTASRAGSLVGGTTPGYLISLKDSLHLVGEPPGHATGTALPRNLLGELGDVREVVPLPTEDRVFFLARVRGASETRLLSFPVDAYAVSDVPIVPTDG